MDGTLTLPVRVDLEVMAMKGHFIIPRSLELEPHLQMQFSTILKIPFFREGFSQCRKKLKIKRHIYELILLRITMVTDVENK